MAKVFTNTVRFTSDVVVKDHRSEIVFQAAAGEVRELSVASARRWIRRNLATPYSVKHEKAEEAPPKPARGRPRTVKKEPAAEDVTKESPSDGGDNPESETAARPRDILRRSPPAT